LSRGFGCFSNECKALGQDRICSVKPSFVYSKDWNFQWDFPFWSETFCFSAAVQQLELYGRLNPTDQGFTEIGEHPWLSALEVHSFSKALVPRAYLCSI
jgi:hypothetical protein